MMNSRRSTYMMVVSRLLLGGVISLSILLVYFDGVECLDYDGYYDISAKDTAYLCSLMDEYKRSGKQPDIVNHPAENFPKEKYLRTGGDEDDKCWVNKWYPCDEEDLKKVKPCGWYKMEKAPKLECK